MTALGRRDWTKSRLRKQPTAMRLQEITPALILALLDHLERERGNSVRSRNARLAALRAFLKFAGRRDDTRSAVHKRELCLVAVKDRPADGLERQVKVALPSISDEGRLWDA